ncbi:zinc-finger domain-containing protein, partial [Bacillus cereus]
MNKTEIRIEIINLQDKHCRECDYRNDPKMRYCWDHCEIGQRLNQLGIYLGGQNAQNKKKIRTKEMWNELC